MFIVDRAKAIVTSIADLGRKEVGVQLAQRLTQVSQRSETSAERLRSAGTVIARLKEEGIAVPDLDGRATELAKSARKRLRTNATRLSTQDLDEPDMVRVLDGEPFQKMLNDANAVADRLATIIGKALEAERVERLPHNVNDVIPDVPKQALSVTRLRRAKEILQRPVSSPPTGLTPEALEELLTQRSARLAATETWNEVYPKLLAALALEPEDLRQFLKATATEEGAQLSLLTEDVRRRLESDRALDDFRIVRR